MSNTVLVTDSLFIFDEHVHQLSEAGYEVERLDVPKATERQLIEAVKGKVGYILGGIEEITDNVIGAADELKAIVFTGADYQHFIPGWQKAKEKGIAIANSAGSNADAVSEFAMTLALSMQRNLFELGKTGDKTFQTTGSLSGATIGIIGSGNIGRRIVNLVTPFHPTAVQYTSRSEKTDLNADFVTMDELLSTSDIIFVAIPASAGQLLNKDRLDLVKNNALIVSISASVIFDLDSLLEKLQSGSLRAAVDWPAPNEAFTSLSLKTWFNTNEGTAYNTTQANKLASDRAITSMINLLSDKDDDYRVV